MLNTPPPQVVQSHSLIWPEPLQVSQGDIFPFNGVERISMLVYDSDILSIAFKMCGEKVPSLW